MSGGAGLASHSEDATRSGHANHPGHDRDAGHSGHTAHSGHADHAAQFRRLFWVMLLLAVPVVASSGMFAGLVGYPLPDAPWVAWVSPVLGSVMYLWGGRPFLTGGLDEARRRSPGMMLLIALALTVAFLASLGASVGLLDPELDVWWELALLVVIMLLGHWIEMRSLARTTSAIDAIAALLPDTAERVEGGAVVAVPPGDLVVGDTVLVRAGAAVPADGTVASGEAAVDEAMITGESAPVRRGPGDRVVAGTVATDSALRVRVDAVGDETALAGIRRLVADAQTSSTRAQRLADTAAGWLFWFALAAAAVAAVAWSVAGMPDAAVVRAVSVLVIACPHALGLAIPLVVSIATERAARAGALVSDRLALETLRNVDTVVFDKTGTLTRGEPAVIAVEAAAGSDESRVLAAAAAAEADSEHPLGRAIVASASARSLDVRAATGFASSPAVGVAADVAGERVEVGGPALLAARAADPLPATETWQAAGAIVVHVLADGRVLGAIRLDDEVRPESLEAVEALHADGVDTVMITGDAEPVARSVAAALGVGRVLAGVRPEGKAAAIAELQGDGRVVAMVGDGVNDAPALAQADVGIAIGAGTDVAAATAGVVLGSSDPRAVRPLIRLSRASYRKMRQNLWWAAGYNLAAVPLAAGVLAPIGFVLPMSVGAILMSASTVVVALNAQLLRRVDMRP